MNVLPLLAALALSDPATAQLQHSTPSQAILHNCQVFLIDDVEVPALESGALVSLNVKEGDLVTRDELLAQIDDRQAQLLKQSAQSERDAVG